MVSTRRRAYVGDSSQRPAKMRKATHDSNDNELLTEGSDNPVSNFGSANDIDPCDVGNAPLSDDEPLTDHKNHPNVIGTPQGGGESLNSKNSLLNITAPICHIKAVEVEDDIDIPDLNNNGLHPSDKASQRSKMTDAQIHILQTHAAKLQSANQALSRNISEKDETIAVMEHAQDRKSRKGAKLTHEVKQLEEFVEHKTRINREKKRQMSDLEKKLELAENKFDDFKQDTAQLIARACRQVEILTQKSAAREKAKGNIQYCKGLVDGGAEIGRHQKAFATEDYKEAEHDERQANRVLNEYLSELFDHVGINVFWMQ